jgi:hypothetical protein
MKAVISHENFYLCVQKKTSHKLVHEFFRWPGVDLKLFAAFKFKINIINSIFNLIVILSSSKTIKKNRLWDKVRLYIYY